MIVTIYSGRHPGAADASHKMLASTAVEVRAGWSVGDVLEAADYTPHNSFALVTPEIEADPDTEQAETITGIYNFLGIDARGVARFDAAQFIPSKPAPPPTA